MRRRLLAPVLLIILVAPVLFGCSQASSAPSALTILAMTEGTVLVMKSGTGSWAEAEVGMSLEPGDAIRTSDSSAAQITFFDGSTIELQAGTEIEVLALDIAADAGATTITLQQTIGTTISRVTQLLDPASRYEIETPTGVAAVRGSIMVVHVGNGGTTWITNQEGDIWGIAQGVDLQVPQQRQCIILSGQPPELVPLNYPPVAEADTLITDEDQPVTIAAPGLLNNDSDGDLGDALTVTAVDLTGTVGSLATWAPNGSLTYDPDGQFEYLPAGNSATDSFNYTISDGNGGSDTAIVTITINGSNDAPTSITLDNSSVAENQGYGTAVGNFSTMDPDTGDTFTYSLVVGAGDDDNVHFTITGCQLQTVRSFDYEGRAHYSIRVRTTDTGSLYYEAALNITITDINDPPVALDDAALTDEESSITAATPGVLANDSDPDAGDTLKVTWIDTSRTTGTVTAWPRGSFYYKPDGKFDYLKAGSSATDSFAYTVSDGLGGTDRATVIITVNGVNDQPTDISLDSSSVAENQPSGTAVGDFSTTDPDTGDAFTYTLVGGEGDYDNAYFTIAGGQLQTAASFDYETRKSYSIRVRSTDSGSLYCEETFSITVTDVNDPPLALDDSATTAQDTGVTIDVLANDSDPDGDTLTVQSVTQGSNGSVLSNGGDVTYTPNAGFYGTDSFRYTISDGNGGTDNAVVTVTVVAGQSLARINIQIDTGAAASVFIWDETISRWATDMDTKLPVDGTNHATPDTISVVGGHYYYVWVEALDVTFYVKNRPKDWVITTAPQGGGEAAYGFAAHDSLNSVHFTVGKGAQT